MTTVLIVFFSIILGLWILVGTVIFTLTTCDNYGAGFKSGLRDLMILFGDDVKYKQKFLDGQRVTYDSIPPNVRRVGLTLAVTACGPLVWLGWFVYYFFQFLGWFFTTPPFVTIAKAIEHYTVAGFSAVYYFLRGGKPTS